MKNITALIITLLFMYGCANNLSKNVGKDYIAEGNIHGINAYVYANHTVIEFDKEPSIAFVFPPVISITDENDRAVAYERVGRFFRVSRKLVYFKVRVNGKLTTFTYNNQQGSTLANKSIY